MEFYSKGELVLCGGEYYIVDRDVVVTDDWNWVVVRRVNGSPQIIYLPGSTSKLNLLEYL